MAWADNLVYGGYDDWRLPTTLIPDPSCSNQSEGTSFMGYNCTGSEMGHLYYTELGNSASGPLANTGPFTNLQARSDWSGTEYAPITGIAWVFYSGGGGQLAGSEDSNHYAWAVHPGDVAAVPEPGTLLLLGSGLAGIAIWRKRLGRTEG